MTKTGWVFPGQGSQAIGMGIDLLEIPAAKAKLEQANQILGWSVAEICQKEEVKLAQTLYTQPCLYVIESILVDLLSQKGLEPDLVAGHSLGEYVALYAAKVLDFQAGLRLVKRRAELMDAAVGGQMSALMGFDRQKLEQEIEKTPGVVLANDNSETQVVISGTCQGIEELLTKVKVKRAMKLNVSGAFHSALMAPAALEFQQVLDSVEFSRAKIPVLSNVDPTPSVDPILLKERLTKQMTGSVLWWEIMLRLSQAGIKQVIEVGPGKVLTGLIKRTCPDIMLENVGSLTELNRVGMMSLSNR